MNVRYDALPSLEAPAPFEDFPSRFGEDRPTEFRSEREDAHPTRMRGDRDVETGGQYGSFGVRHSPPDSFSEAPPARAFHRTAAHPEVDESSGARERPRDEESHGGGYGYGGYDAAAYEADYPGVRKPTNYPAEQGRSYQRTSEPQPDHQQHQGSYQQRQGSYRAEPRERSYRREDRREEPSYGAGGGGGYDERDEIANGTHLLT